MRGLVSAAIPVCYVREIGRSREFYRLFGFTELRGGADGDSAWAYLRSGETTLLLAAVRPLLIQVELPLLIYLYVDDLVTVTECLTAAGTAVDQAGYPDHAPGGEARTVDPDGNVILFGQRTAVATAERDNSTGEAARFSLIREAAEAVNRRGGAPAHCQIGKFGGGPCENRAEVKLADQWGDTVWGCMEHAEEALISARSAFIATEDGLGLGPFLRSRHARGSD